MWNGCASEDNELIEKIGLLVLVCHGEADKELTDKHNLVVSQDSVARMYDWKVGENSFEDFMFVFVWPDKATIPLKKAAAMRS